MWHVISETMKIYVYGIPHMWILKYDTSEFILEIETDSEIWKTNLWSPKGTVKGGKINYKFWINIYTLQYVK